MILKIFDNSDAGVSTNKKRPQPTTIATTKPVYKFRWLSQMGKLKQENKQTKTLVRFVVFVYFLPRKNSRYGAFFGGVGLICLSIDTAKEALLSHKNKW